MNRYFTVDEANALIPVLQEHLFQLQALYDQAQKKYRELEMIKAVGHGPDGRLIMEYDHKLTKAALHDVVGRINAICQEIKDFGCELKNIELGLVDFPAQIDDEEVLLCWQLGEDQVAHYHDAFEGYAGRKPIPGNALDTHESLPTTHQPDSGMDSD